MAEPLIKAHRLNSPASKDWNKKSRVTTTHASGRFQPPEIEKSQAAQKTFLGFMSQNYFKVPAQKKYKEWQLIFNAVGPQLSELSQSGRIWRSVTPYLRPWHQKKGFGTEEQVKKECRLRGLPEPEVEYLPTISIGKSDRPCRPIHFHRFRNKRNLHQPDRQGSFLQLTFPTPIQGPLTLGFANHFALGLFIPAKERP